VIDGKSVLAVVPARCGSKGVRLKNIRKVNDVPLVSIVGALIRKVPYIDRTVVSTDCEEVAVVARQAGLDVPFFRPDELSGDEISDLQVLTHALREPEALDSSRYEIVCMLQPTCPMRRPEHVSESIRRLTDEDYDAVWTVSETDSKAHPLKQLVVSTRGDLSYYDEKGAHIVARQQLKPVYHRNGAAYAITRECILTKRCIKGIKTGAVIIRDRLVNIDTEEDLEYCDYLLRNGGDQG